MLDIHCHILPRVDDGSKSLSESERMLSIAQEAGVTELVATPHLYKAEPEHLFKVRRAFTLMSMKARGYGIELYLGYETLFDNVKKLDASKYCTNWPKPIKPLLLEFQPTEYPREADLFICDCVKKGITPIIAHPERYKFVQDDINMISYLRGYGCLIQVDARAMALPFYTAERKTAQALITSGLADSISSDAHNIKHYRQYAKTMDDLDGYWEPLDFDITYNAGKTDKLWSAGGE